MSKLITRISTPIILAGTFVITMFIALDYENIQPSFYIILVLLITFVFLFGYASGQNIASPLKKLLNKATELSNGNFSSRVYLETKDELAELADTFNKIAEELEISQEKEMNVEKSVGIKVRAKTQELEETINALEQKVKNRTVELERLIGESNKLQADVKGKAAEVMQLRKDLENFSQKVGKNKKSKTISLEE